MTISLMVNNKSSVISHSLSTARTHAHNLSTLNISNEIGSWHYFLRFKLF